MLDHPLFNHILPPFLFLFTSEFITELLFEVRVLHSCCIWLGRFLGSVVRYGTSNPDQNPCWHTSSSRWSQESRFEHDRTCHDKSLAPEVGLLCLWKYAMTRKKKYWIHQRSTFQNREFQSKSLGLGVLRSIFCNTICMLNG